MKISGAKKVHYDSGPNMTPLVDVVMVILIFLMLAGSFGGVEHYLVSNAGFVDKGTSSAKLPPNFVPPTNLIVRVDLDPDSVGEAQSMSKEDAPRALRYTATLAGKTYKSEASLHDALVALAADPAYADKKNVQVVISPGFKVLHRHLISVYQAALDSKFEKVAFSKAH